MSDWESSFECPVCGAEVPAGRLACPECGADERTGWGADTTGPDLGLPEEAGFDYDAFLKKEGLAPDHRLRPEGVSRGWWVVGLVVLAALVVWVVRG